MPFRLHDTLTAQSIALPARVAGETSLYVCGPTVYNFIHVGNARPAVVFDLLVRHLRAGGTRVRFVRNFTDIDDRIIATAVAHREEPMVVAQRYIDAYLEDTGALNCRRPDHEPRVSQFVPEIVAMVQTLIAKGYAYELAGDVYYRARKFPGYGKLSKRRLDDLEVGARVAADERKEDALDFALWKAAKPTEPVGARWPSPWSEGRPGWHIECSAMARKILGDGFDLHGGGLDLIFPHHENEIAQSEAATGTTFAHGWMHNGFIEMDLGRPEEYSPEVAERLPALRERDKDLLKISKSDPAKLSELRARPGAELSLDERAMGEVLARKVQYGHWFQLRRLLTRVDPEALRLWIVGTHYRAPLAFELRDTSGPREERSTVDANPIEQVSFPGIEQAEARVEYFYETRARLLAKLGRASVTPGALDEASHAGRMLRAFDDALDDDLNVALALSHMGEAFKRANEVCDAKGRDTAEARSLLDAIDHMTEVLGVADGDPERFFARVRTRRATTRQVDTREIDALVRERSEARTAKDFARADAIRKDLTARGIDVRDVPGGESSWRFTVTGAPPGSGGPEASQGGTGTR